MDVVLKVPVRSFVYKYLTSKYGNPWRINSRYKDARVFQYLLARTPNRYDKFITKDMVILDVVIPTQIHLKKGSYLSQECIHELHEIINDNIMHEIETFYRGVTTGLGLKDCNKVRVIVNENTERFQERRIDTREAFRFFAQKQIIYDILKKYDITEEDLTYDCVVKRLQRSLKHKN
jgi:hypothetical protein